MPLGRMALDAKRRPLHRTEKSQLVAMSEKEFDALKMASKGILESRRQDHAGQARTHKCHAIYIQLTPGKEDAPTPELIVEKALADSNLAEAIFHAGEADRYEQALSALNESTNETSN
jgi:hypothetical protein